MAGCYYCVTVSPFYHHSITVMLRQQGVINLVANRGLHHLNLGFQIVGIVISSTSSWSRTDEWDSLSFDKTQIYWPLHFILEYRSIVRLHSQPGSMQIVYNNNIRRYRNHRYITDEQQKGQNFRSILLFQRNRDSPQHYFPRNCIPCYSFYLHEFTARSRGPTCLSNWIISRQ